MEITVNKKKINTVLFFLLFVVVLFLGYFLIRGFPLSWNIYSLDKYEELTELCPLHSSNNGIEIKCNAFLKSIEYINDGNVCLSLSLVINNNSEIKDIKICESTKLVHLNDPELSSEMLVPVEVVFKYIYKIPFSYKLESIEPSILEDEITLDILHKLSDNGVNLFNVRTNEVADIQKKGYYKYEFDSKIEDNTIGIITFTKSTIKDIHSSDGEISLTMNITVNGKEREVTINVAEFTYNYFNNRDVNDLRSIHVTSENISEVPLNKSLSTTFIYIPYGKEINVEEIKKYCNGDSIQWRESLCSNVDNVKEMQLDKDIDEYVKESLDKLILDSMISNE